MENKINIAEILKNCPKGMELDCTMLDDVVFEKISFGVPNYPIVLKRLKTNTTIYLTKYGQYSDPEDYKCVIFPKGKTTWEGFVPPCKFKDGDVVVAEGKSCQLFLLKHVKYREDNNGYDGYCYFGWDFLDNRLFEKGNWGFNRLATEEERQRLFQAIEEHGYKWNAETKILEKLVEPKFKVGDRIQNIYNGKQFTITKIYQDYYECDDRYVLTFENQDIWELTSDKFDINTLVPFESRVLVRDCDDDKWHPGIWGFYDKGATSYPYKLIGDIVRYCIPYEGNEHLLGKTDDCSDFYKIWE